VGVAVPPKSLDASSYSMSTDPDLSTAVPRSPDVTDVPVKSVFLETPIVE
jgi:hypothetical protein